MANVEWRMKAKSAIVTHSKFDLRHSRFAIPMDPLQTAFDYHERTKHHFHRYAASLGYLDWANQPDPFRRYQGAALHCLTLVGESPTPSYDELFVPGAIPPRPIHLASISALFEFSLALSAWKEYQGSRWALRINPSSGNLHPTEGYLVARPIEGLHDSPAVYHYAPKEHGLERRCVRHCSLSSGSVINSGFLVGLTSVHWREAWKYGERAYRYCQHDIGHALAAVSIAAALLGWRARIVDIDDAPIVKLLGLDRDADFTEAEREQPDLLLHIAPDLPPCQGGIQRGSNEFWAQALCGAPVLDTDKAPSPGVWSGRANALSRDHVDWPIVDDVAVACIRKNSPPLDESPAAFSSPIQPARATTSATQIIRQRRSAIAFDGRTAITAGQFFLMLDRTLPRSDRPPWSALPPPISVHLAVFLHLVEGLPRGLYLFVRDPGKLAELRAACDPTFAWSKPEPCPDGLPLYLLRTGDARRVAVQVSCGQEIAGAGAFSLGMIAEFEGTLRTRGAWFYRRLFWETGAIGQVLYLEAEAAGVRGTGIGCFFDDPVHDLLGLKDRRFQSLYHFTVGGPIEDVRLMTRPAYG